MTDQSIVSVHNARRIYNLISESNHGRIVHEQGTNPAIIMWARRCTVMGDLSGGIVLGIDLAYNKKAGIQAKHYTKRLKLGWSEKQFVRTMSRLYCSAQAELFRQWWLETLENNLPNLSEEDSELFSSDAQEEETRSGRTMLYDCMTTTDIEAWIVWVNDWKARRGIKETITCEKNEPPRE